LKDSNYIKDRKGRNQRLSDISNELKYWLNENWNVYFIFITTDTRGQKIDALVDAYNTKFSDTAFNIRFDAWRINELKDILRRGRERLEKKFKETKSRGDFRQVDYGRKKPYPRSNGRAAIDLTSEIEMKRLAGC
jgi:hypothetical protein